MAAKWATERKYGKTGTVGLLLMLISIPLHEDDEEDVTCVSYLLFPSNNLDSAIHIKKLITHGLEENWTRAFFTAWFTRHA